MKLGNTPTIPHCFMNTLNTRRTAYRGGLKLNLLVDGANGRARVVLFITS
ncbi:MAG: hypothetical protein ACOX3C_00525 [Bacilli bacterium]